MSHANFDVSALTAYVQENKDLLIKDIVLGKGTRSRISIQPGVKYKERLHPFEVETEFADGSDCGFTAAGSVKISERLIETAEIKVNMEICPKNLVGKYAEYLVRINATEENLPFEQYIMDGVVKDINKKIEKMIWQGDKTLTTDKVKKWIDGYLKVASDSVTASTGVVAQSISSGKSAYAGILQVYNALSEDCLEIGAEIYVSPAIFRAFMQDMVASNFYHYNPGNGELDEFILPGTDTKVVKTAGLAGSLKIFGTYPKNLYYGCDMEGDSEDIDLWYSKDNRTNRLAVEWNSGVQIAFLEDCVLGTFAAAPVATTSIAANTAELASASHVFKTDEQE